MAEQTEAKILSSGTTTCAVVGGGPAGMMLAYLLARRGVDVTLLEMHGDFDRDFRGDTLHPSILEVLDEVGLADPLLQLPHTQVGEFTFSTPEGQVKVAGLNHLKTKFPFIALMPQARFLEFMAAQAKAFPNFHLLMGAMVDGLIQEQGIVRGVRYRTREGEHELRALLTVGTDGRFSRLRKLSGLDATAVPMSQPIDVVWLRLPRLPNDPHGVAGHVGKGHFLIELDRGDEWQIGLLIFKGSFGTLKAQGIEAMRRTLLDTAPELGDRVNLLTDWKQVALLTVQADRLKRWYEPGLLLIGDAAHVMSPAGGNGINYAVMDAVATANLLTPPLLAGNVTPEDLAKVQKRREHPVQLIQAVVNQLQEIIVGRVLGSEKPRVPGIVRFPLFTDLAARVVGFGIRPEHVAQW